MNTSISYCEWFGVTCGADDIVIGLNHLENNLRGTLPLEISFLVNLTDLSLQTNNIEGNVPTEIGLLTNLISYSIWLNYLTGSMPSEIGLLTKLTNLDFDNNFLVGTIPSELGELTNIKQLWLSKNNFIGPIPSEFGLFFVLSDLYFGHNQLTGTIPSEFGSMIYIINLYLNENSLTGAIPSELGLLAGVQRLILQHNLFSSSIPTEIGLLTNVVDFMLDTNNFDGSIPSELGLLTDVEIFYIFTTFVSGHIPSQLGRFEKATFFVLYFNRLTGSIPTELGMLDSVTYLSLHSNSLSGSIPSEFGHLTDNLYEFFLYLNQLTGPIPSEFGLCTRLGYFQINANNLSGSIPSELGLLQSVTNFIIYLNQLTGRIPTELSQLTSASVLHISTNRLSGSIPSEFGTLTKLRTFETVGNSLTGSIPTEIGLLTNCDKLAFSSNFFTGSIPSEIGNILRIDYLLFSDNLLEGTIPTEYSQIVEMNYIRFNQNQFTGVLPPTLDWYSWNGLKEFDASYNAFDTDLTSFFGRWFDIPNEGIVTSDKALIFIDLQYNKFTGSIPTFFNILGNLQNLNLANNSLSGELYQGVFSGQLANLDISGNLLISGSIPDSWDVYDRLVILNILDTNITGPLPSFLQYSLVDYYQPDISNPFACPTIERIDAATGEVSAFDLRLNTGTFNKNESCVCVSGYFGDNGVCVACNSNWCSCVTDDVIDVGLVSHMSGCFPLYEFDESFGLTVTKEVLPCPSTTLNKDVCHSTALGEFECSKGYQNRLCSQCSQGYFANGRECSKCNITASYFLLLVYLLLMLVLVWYLYNSYQGKSTTGTLKILLFHFQMMSILITAGVEWNDVISNTFETMSSGSELATSPSIDCILDEIFHWAPESSINDNFIHQDAYHQNEKFYFDIVSPIFVILMIVIGYGTTFMVKSKFKSMASAKSKKISSPSLLNDANEVDYDSYNELSINNNTQFYLSENNNQKGMRTKWNHSLGFIINAYFKDDTLRYIVISLTFFFYFSVANVVFEIFGCTLVGGNNRYLNTHPWYQCYPFNDPYEKVFGLNFLFLFLLISFPIYVYLMILKEKSANSNNTINNNSIGVSGSSIVYENDNQNSFSQKLLLSLDPIGKANSIDGDNLFFLSPFVACFDKNCWWWEFILLIRRLIVAMVVNVIPFHETEVLTLIVFTILFIAIYIQQKYRPFYHWIDNELELLSLYLLSISYVVGLVGSLTGQMNSEIQWTLAISHIFFGFLCIFFIILDFIRNRILSNSNSADHDSATTTCLIFDQQGATIRNIFRISSYFFEIEKRF